MEVFNLNIIPGAVAPIIHASQYDEDREFRANLFEGDQVFELTGEEIISVNVRKTDGNVVTAAVVNTGANYVDFSTTLQMTACAGANLCQLRIENSPRKIGTLNFILAVERDPLEGGIQSESEINNLATQVAEMVAEDVAEQYDSANVIFDNEPTDNHGIGYTVTSEGIKNAIDNAFDYDNTASGSIVHITDGADNIPVKSLVSEIVAVESGSGEKSPDNPYTISGFDSGIITVTDNDQITNTYTFAFGQTVYGGYFDNKGNLVSDFANERLDAKTWSYNSGRGAFNATFSGKDQTRFNKMICSCYANGGQIYSTSEIASKPDKAFYTQARSDTVFIKDSDYTDPTTWLNALGSNTLCYPLTTPTKLSITSQDIPTLLGENNIFSNTGDVEVNYYTSKSNDILEFIDSEIGKKNGTNIPIEENSQDSIKDYIDNVSLSGLPDTDISSPSASQVLSFDGNNWVNTNQIVVKYEEKDIAFDSSGEGTLYYANGYILGLKDIPSDSLYIGYITYMAGTKTMVKGFNRSATSFDSTAIANTTRRIGIYYLDNIATQ